MQPVATLSADNPRAPGPHPEPPAAPDPLSQKKEDSPAIPVEREKLNPSSGVFDEAVNLERVRREKLVRLGAVMSDAERSNAEARAAKAKKRPSKFRSELTDGFEEIPPELRTEADARKVRVHLKEIWLSEIQKAYPGPTLQAWTGRERGQLNHVLDHYDADRVEDAFRYVIRNWQMLSQRLFKEGRRAPIPSLGVVAALHATLIPEASIWAKHRSTLEEYANYGGEYEERPSELLERYLEAKKELKSLGL